MLQAFMMWEADYWWSTIIDRYDKQMVINDFTDNIYILSWAIHFVENYHTFFIKQNL